MDHISSIEKLQVALQRLTLVSQTLANDHPWLWAFVYRHFTPATRETFIADTLEATGYINALTPFAWIRSTTIHACGVRKHLETFSPRTMSSYLQGTRSLVSNIQPQVMYEMPYQVLQRLPLRVKVEIQFQASQLTVLL